MQLFGDEYYSLLEMEIGTLVNFFLNFLYKLK